MPFTGGVRSHAFRCELNWRKPPAGIPLLRCRTPCAADKIRALRAGADQSAVAFSIIAACSFLMSSGDNCGRSTLMVSLLSLAVSGNGGL